MLLSRYGAVEKDGLSTQTGLKEPQEVSGSVNM